MHVSVLDEHAAYVFMVNTEDTGNMFLWTNGIYDLKQILATKIVCFTSTSLKEVPG
jgi:hypothetical protein